MAEKRMFTQKIIDSDAFLDMPLSSQSLYFHLNMRADDEGFINNPKKISRMIGSSEDDMKLLLAKNFIISFDSGVIVIKHWKMHNAIRADRIKNSQYTEEKALLRENENKSYSVVSQMLGSCQADDRIDKIRLDKYRLDKSSNKDEKTSLKKQIAIKLQESENVINKTAFNEWLDYKKYKSIAPITKTINFLIKYDFATQQQIIDNSIMNGYKGLFEPKQQQQPYNTPKYQTLNTDVNVWDMIEEQSQREQGAING